MNLLQSMLGVLKLVVAAAEWRNAVDAPHAGGLLIAGSIPESAGADSPHPFIAKYPTTLRDLR